MMKIYLIRHGQSASVASFTKDQKYFDPDLNEIGKKQADLLGLRLQHYEIKTIYSSDLKRAHQTAEIINRYLQVKIMLRSQLREIDMGDIPRLGWAAYPDYHAEWEKHETDLPYPEGEAGIDVKKRVQEVLDEITECVENVAIVTHGGVIMVLLSAILGMAQEKRFRFSPIENCSINTLVYDQRDQSMKVHQVNDIAHIELGK